MIALRMGVQLTIRKMLAALADAYRKSKRKDSGTNRINRRTGLKAGKALSPVPAEQWGARAGDIRL